MSIPLTSQVPQLTGGKDNDQLTIDEDDVVKMQMR